MASSSLLFCILFLTVSTLLRVPELNYGFGVEARVSDSKLVKKELIPRDIEQNIPLSIPSGLVIFAVRNQTNSITVTVVPSCRPSDTCRHPQSHMVPNVSLPNECKYRNCKDILTITDEAELSSTNCVQYILVIPITQGVLLLRFEYCIDTQILEFREQSIVDTQLYNCNPTFSTQLGKSYYTLCIDSSSRQLTILRLMNVQNFSRTFFEGNPNLWIPFNSSPSAISGLDSSSYNSANPYKILFGIGSGLYLVDLIRAFYDRIDFPECVGYITQIEPVSMLVEYVLLYCQVNYGVADIFEGYYEVRGVDYYENGYPIVCSGVGSILNITNNGTQSILHYNTKALPLIGETILLNESLCFGTNRKLLYLYTDLVLGTFLLDLDREEVRNISSNACPNGKIDFCSLPRVFQERYILLTEKVQEDPFGQNSTLKLFDVLQNEMVSLVNADYSLDIVLMLELPQRSQQGLSNSQLGLILGVSCPLGIIVTIILIIILFGVTGKLCQRRPGLTPPQPVTSGQGEISSSDHDLVVPTFPPGFRPR